MLLKALSALGTAAAPAPPPAPTPPRPPSLVWPWKEDLFPEAWWLRAKHQGVFLQLMLKRGRIWFPNSCVGGVERAQILRSGSQPYFLLSPGRNLAPQLGQGTSGLEGVDSGSPSPPQPEPDPTYPSLGIGRCVVLVSPTHGPCSQGPDPQTFCSSSFPGQLRLPRPSPHPSSASNSKALGDECGGLSSIGCYLIKATPSSLSLRVV